jgi:hypothetical protein
MLKLIEQLSSRLLRQLTCLHEFCFSETLFNLLYKLFLAGFFDFDKLEVVQKLHQEAIFAFRNAHGDGFRGLLDHVSSIAKLPHERFKFFKPGLGTKSRRLL